MSTHVRAEFEFTCSECQTILRTLPANRRTYYDEVHVLEAERQAALRDQLRQICGRVGRRIWRSKLQLVLVVLAIVAVVVWL